SSVLFFFFFQAEDGIRDWSVTGVQTCALPIYGPHRNPEAGSGGRPYNLGPISPPRRSAVYRIGWMLLRRRLLRRAFPGSSAGRRSEERRVGKEGRCRGGGGALHEER